MITQGDRAGGRFRPSVAIIKDLTDDGIAKRGRRKAERIWRKMSVRREPLEIEAAGGVMGI